MCPEMEQHRSRVLFMTPIHMMLDEYVQYCLEQNLAQLMEVPQDLF